MYYCPPNVTFLNLSIKHGFSQCFADTVSSFFVSAFILLFGSVQIDMYMRFYSDTRVFPKSLLYKLQLVCHFILPLMALIRLILQSEVFHDDVYGYTILSACLYSITFPFAVYLLYLERHKALPGIPSKGHGLVLLVYWTALFVSENLTFLNLRNEKWWFQLKSLSDKIEFGLFVTRYVCSFFIFCLGLKAPGIPNVEDSLIQDGLNIQESAGLLDSWSQSADRKRSVYADFYRKCKRLIPFIWPKKSRMLQLRVLFCIVLLILGRGLNVFVPIFNQKIVDRLSESGRIVFPTDYILLYAMFWFLQGPGDNNILSNIRSFLWISVQQYTVKEVEMDIYKPLHSLSVKWHLNKKIGEVRRVINRGTSRISNLHSYFIFNIVPTFVDIVFAVLYFVIFKGCSLLAVTIFGTMVLYLTATIVLIEWRTKFKRDANKLENEAEAKCVDSLLNFETVNYYNAEQFEFENYKKAIEKFQIAEWKSIASFNLLNTAQNITITLGVLAGTYLCASYVLDETDEFTAGDYVMFSTYIVQLYTPLSFFGTHYRWFQTAFVDMENMFTLLDTESEIVDKPDANSLKVREGSIEFRNVNFSYVIERQILKDISFTIPPGRTVAIVGPTGSGKSTITRLLFRFYDVGSGEILIDGRNISDVTQKSLRESIGVVPQDTVLFNNTIRYNIGYGRPGASFEEIQEAAKAVDMHELILRFPDAYDTVVGERGLKLSAGEKQRVAIARTILKSPSIVILDEATSSLDTQTEKNIQKSLSNVCANKTALITAHRLSTIVHVHEILVLKEGEIVERGSHEELLKKNGMYALMWLQQQEPEKKEND